MKDLQEIHVVIAKLLHLNEQGQLGSTPLAEWEKRCGVLLDEEEEGKRRGRGGGRREMRRRGRGRVGEGKRRRRRRRRRRGEERKGRRG